MPDSSLPAPEPERLSDEEVHPSLPKRCVCWPLERYDREACPECPGDTGYLTPVASPRREAPADALSEIIAAQGIEMEHHNADGKALITKRSLALLAAGYELVPPGHHVSPEGQTVIDGKRWTCDPLSREQEMSVGMGVPVLYLTLRPVGPSGEGDEADA